MRIIALLFIVFVLSSCGGGGSPAPVNHNPPITPPADEPFPLPDMLGNWNFTFQTGDANVSWPQDSFLLHITKKENTIAADLPQALLDVVGDPISYVATPGGKGKAANSTAWFYGGFYWSGSGALAVHHFLYNFGLNSNEELLLTVKVFNGETRDDAHISHAYEATYLGAKQ